MKQLWILSIAALLGLGSCAQSKENREEFKAEHDKEYLKNSIGDSAVAHSEPAPVTLGDAARKPVDTATEKSVDRSVNKPNTEVGGYR